MLFVKSLSGASVNSKGADLINTGEIVAIGNDPVFKGTEAQCRAAENAIQRARRRYNHDLRYMERFGEIRTVVVKGAEYIYVSLNRGNKSPRALKFTMSRAA